MRLHMGASVLAMLAAFSTPVAAQLPPVILPTKEPPAQPKLRTGADVPVAKPSAPVTLTPKSGDPSITGNPTNALIRQARTWRQRGRSDLAFQALRKAVSIEPNNAEVLYLLAQYSALNGDRNAALPWLDRLRNATAPRDGRVVAVEKLLQSPAQPSQSSPDQPVVARAAGGAAGPSAVLEAASAAPVATSAPPPPPAIVEAVQNPRVQAPAAASPQKTAQAQAPRRVVNADPGGNARAAGFVALNDGRLGDAENLFKRALAARSSDTDSQGGLGIVRLRQQRFGEAERLLAQAMKGAAPSRWQDAFNSARFFDRFGKAREALVAGNLAEAETLARPLADGVFKDRIEAQLLLGDIYTRQQRYAEAQAVYSDVYNSAPDRQEAVAGLAESLSQLGRSDEALRLLDRLPRTTGTKEARSRIERARAADLQRRGDDFGAGAALAASLAADPSNPWTRYDYARFLLARGQAQQASEVAGPLFSGAATDLETLQAAALYADFIGRPDQASSLLERIPLGQRNAAVRELAERVDIKNSVARAQAMYRNGQSVQAVSLLREAAARPGIPFGARSQIAQALLDMGDAYQAGNLALAAARDPIPADARPGDAAGFLAVLGAGGQDAAANNILQQMAQRVRSPEDQAAWRQTYAAYGEKRADTLRTAGDLASAFDVLSAAMAVAPRDTGLIAALARLYAAGNMGREANQAYDMVLAQRPNDLLTIMDAARAASAAQDFDRASRLLQRAARLRPDDPEVMYDIGKLARARGREREALSAFERADRLLARAADPRMPGVRTAQTGLLGPNPFARAASVPARSQMAASSIPYAPVQGGGGYVPTLSGPYDVPMTAGMGTGGAANPFAMQPSAQPAPAGMGTMVPANRQPGVPMGALPKPSDGGYREIMNSLVPMEQPSEPYLQAPVAPLPAARTPSYTPPMTPAYGQSYPSAPRYEPPAPAYQVPSIPIPAYQQAAPAPAYPAPSYPVVQAQVPSAPAAPYPAPAYQAPTYQAPAYPTQAYPTPAYQVPSYPVPTQQASRGLPGIPDAPLTQVDQEPNVDNPILGARIEPITDPTAPLAVRIRSEMQASRSDSVPLVEASVNSRLRSGEAGTSNLIEIGGQIDASVPILGIGQIGLSLRPVSLIAGRATGAAVGRTGSYPLITAPGIINGVPVTLPDQQARSTGGIGGSIFFRTGWASADVGITPYGFRFNDIVGGVKLTPKFGRLELRLSAERRAVEDSILSWAGDFDPISGLTWGGVRKLQGTLGLSLNLENAGGYIDGTIKRYEGRNVPRNDAVELNGGFYWRPINETDQRLQVGLNLNYQSFDRNLRYFTLGHGGYFSPSQFIAVGLPITYQGAGNDWRIALNLTPGIQAYSEDTAAIFPGFSQQQAQLVAFSLVDNTVPAFYTGTSRSGFGLAGRLNGEYRIQRRTVIGGLLSVDTFGAFSEFRFNIFLRQQLDFGK